MRAADGRPPAGDATAKVLRRILEACRKCGVPAGLHCTSAEEARARIEEGWQFLAVTSELKMMLESAAQVVQTLAGDRPRGELAKY
jgi:4-hydroxy-2-oxoheptanedioate aldolase